MGPLKVTKPTHFRFFHRGDDFGDAMRMKSGIDYLSHGIVFS
jgi:hypothetical protein